MSVVLAVLGRYLVVDGNTTIASNATDIDAPPEDETTHDSNVLALAFCLVVVFALILLAYIFPGINSRSRDNENNIDSNVGVLTPEDKETRLKERKCIIQQWLRTSPVVQHDHCRADEEQLSSCHVSMKEDNNRDTEETMCCQICMEEWQVGDTVAYSGRHCQHVFHFDCIESWLMKHKDCPYCRQIMLSVDEQDFCATADEPRDLKGDVSSFCICHGLQTLEQDRNPTHDDKVESKPVNAAKAVMAQGYDCELSTIQTVDDAV